MHHLVHPDEGQYLDVDGIKTFYIKKGRGYPLLLIHGGAPGVCSMVSWRPNIDYFADSGFTVYAFDQPGFGYTENPTDFSLEYRYRHAKSFIDKMGLDSFHTIANSQGAYISAKIAMENPRAGRMVFTASATVAPRGSFESHAQAQHHRQELGNYAPSLDNIRTMTMKTLFHKELVDDDLVRTRYEMSIGKNAEAQMRRKEAPAPKPIIEDLANLKTKTLLIWGKNDQGVALERGVLLFQLLPDAELHIFNECGHWAQWDQTARFHSIVHDFLKASTADIS